MSEAEGEGCVAFVTGGGDGIGRATALRLAAAGAAVAVADRDVAAAEATAAAIRAAGGVALPLPCDVSDEAAVAAAVGRTAAELGRLDWAVNNAGVSGGSPGADDWDPARWEQAIAVNLRGTMFCMKHQVALMRGQGSGAIVNVASIAGLVGAGGFSYAATKHAVVGLTRAAGVRYAAEGIRVNAVCPGMVRTAMIARADPDMVAEMAAAQPIGRIAEPEEVAETIFWLCSERASYMAGQAIAVDGGFTAA